MNLKHKIEQSLDDDDNKYKKVKSLSSSTVILNISGTKFQCDKIIFQRFPDTVLGVMFNQFIHSDEIFFDRDPDIFKHILNFYRTGILSTLLLNPNLFDHNIVQHELKAWGIILPSTQLSMDLEDSKEYKEAWDETRLFLENFIQDKRFIKELPNIYFQDIQKLHFTKYYNKDTDSWKIIPDNDYDIKNLDPIINKYWKTPSQLDPLLYEMYCDNFFKHNSEDTDLCDSETLIDIKLLDETINQAMQIKIAPTFTRLLHRPFYWDDCSDSLVLLKYLKHKIVLFFNNNGYNATWKTKEEDCKILPRDEDDYSYCNVKSNFSHYPFNMQQMIDGDVDERRYPGYWCRYCLNGSEHEPIKVQIDYLEVSFMYIK